MEVVEKSNEVPNLLSAESQVTIFPKRLPRYSRKSTVDEGKIKFVSIYNHPVLGESM